MFPQNALLIPLAHNVGLGCARNIGLSYATGTYVSFVNADDWILPYMYGEMAESGRWEMVSSMIYKISSEDDQAGGRFREETGDMQYIDVIINKNLQFFYQKCRAYPFVACEDYNAVLQGNYVAHKSHIGLSSEKPYFNSGVLYMDIQYLRRNSYMQRLLEDIEANFSRYTLVDQDALNILMQDVVHFEKWQEYNCPAAYYYRKQDGSFLSYEEIRGLSSQTGDITNDTDRMVAEAAIIHYCIEVKPWDGGNFYEKSGMRKALQVYQRYQKMAERLLRKASTDG